MTYWAFEEKFSQIMNQLDDPSDENDCILFYRPSFGRANNRKNMFGEFDAILITPLCLYLIESKWDCSNELKTGVLNDGQLFRHYCFTWIAKNWDCSISFKEFAHSHTREFKDSVREFIDSGLKNGTINAKSAPNFRERVLPPHNSEVGLHMQYILLKSREKMRNFQVRNVVLVLLDNDAAEPKVKFQGFQKVTVRYKSIKEVIEKGSEPMRTGFFYINRSF